MPDTKNVLPIVLAAAGVALIAGLILFPLLRGIVHHHRLVGRLDSGSAAERLSAAIELGELRDERAVVPLVAALALGQSADTRSEDEVAALCKIGGAGTIRMLAAALPEPGFDRGRIIEALACIDDPAARAVLAKSLQGEDDTLRQVAIMALGASHDQKIVDLLVDAERHAERGRRLQIVASLANPAGGALDPRLARILSAALDDPDASIRIAAAESLVWNYLNHTVPAQAVVEALRNRNPDVRTAIADKLASYRPMIPRAADSGIQRALAALPVAGGRLPKLDASRDEINHDLATAAERASALLAARQDPAGYWLTFRTRDPRFERAYGEMNTYLTPVIVDMLAPVAGEAGLGGNLSRARKQIRAEIENTGLVRYYGHGARAVGQGRICAISPDADDTALAWRIAPSPNTSLLRNALATLRQYRAPNGLYRTWLAPLDRFRCIDRGRDPDPTDVGIQMHLLMFLIHASPAEGQALCTAVQKTIADDRIWIYYRLEPLIPMLRQADLEKIGCRVQVPESRLQTGVPGQGKWIAAGLSLLSLLQANGSTPNSSETADLLHKLAQGDFQAIRRSPPLIYQNDVTGSAPGFYWSEEFGYALWLRLYFENMRRSRHPTVPGKPG